MNRHLTKILRCPVCRNDVDIYHVESGNNNTIIAGTLSCVGCSKKFPVKLGIPCMAIAEKDVMSTGKRFNSEWVAHEAGYFEKQTCYGLDEKQFVAWLEERLTERAPLSQNDWILDAGCGKGDKTAILAKQSRKSRVVGVDLGFDSLAHAATRYDNLPNIDYVQANILNLPFKDNTFKWGISIGVLHHTPDTRHAFSLFRKALKAKAGMVIWLYPTWKSDPIWRLAYNARYILMGCSHLLPPFFIGAFAATLTALFFPIIDMILMRSSIHKDLPFFVYNEQSIANRYKTLVFFTFDSLLPKYQFHHSKKEVNQWAAENNFQITYDSHGFYIGHGHP